MDPFNQIWESSRTNDYSWGYPAVVWAGVGVLIALSLIRHNVLRRILKVIAIGGLVMTATQWSSSEIEEKWRIRAEWADTHPAEMTEQGYEALTVDGANRTLGPLIYGFQAGLIFVGVAAVLFVIRLAIRKQPMKPLVEAPPEIETEVATDLHTSDNPYHPPADSA
ncbi:hypothetical protein [Crateriforma conspicua]|uniref:Uncharacterized protein n=1 Tax=Crateriforma conspicua TaxID=2527996 RepID=A0A5C5Y0G3_9PLAN|nr:hypothetical protein [Crateriforma conspicua]QDV62289.1 hypothetical protein Mal65_14230 [Crateriforma conspicua]TWT68664.1 hypothetical protein Pan14r_09110 [Crateriforma conspicua]